MKRLVSVAVLGTFLSAAPWVLAAPESDQEKLGYSLGVTLGQSLKQDVADLNLDSFTQAIKDVYAGDDLTDEPAMAEAIARGGVAIKIGEGDSLAQYRMSGPKDLAAWLDSQFRG